MSKQEKEIRELVYQQLGAAERYRLAIAILQDYQPLENVEDSLLLSETKEEYTKRKAQFLDGEENSRPWKEVIALIESKKTK